MTASSRAFARPLPADLSEGKVFSARQLEILETLDTIVLTEGFRELTVGGLAERLRCSRRTLYEIADSKEGLVLIVIDRVMRRLARTAHDAASREERLLDQLRAFLVHDLTELRRATLSFSEDVAAFPEAGQLILNHFRYARGTVEAMLRTGIESGEFAVIHPRIAAETFDAGLQRLLDPRVLRSAGVGFAEAIEEYLTLFIDGIRAPSPAPAAAPDRRRPPSSARRAVRGTA
jgi:AcrR family transcriptional regulator